MSTSRRSSTCHGLTSAVRSSSQLILRRLKRALPLSCIVFHSKRRIKLNCSKISGQYKRLLIVSKHSFLMLELLIALFLVGVCALPLAQHPMKALQEETRSAYRMQLHRLADIAFAEFKEKIYQQEIPWKEICSPREAKSIFIPKEPAKVDFEPLR